MDTNTAQEAITRVAPRASGDMDFCTVLSEPDLLGTFLWLVTVTACVAVAVLAVRNAVALFRREIVPEECARIPLRIAISGYLLVFLAA